MATGGSAGFFIGPWLGGIILTHLGGQALFAMMFISGALGGISLLVVSVLHSRKTTKQTSQHIV
ncbi:hypothetical protein ACW2QC_19195 [Virgibacillus sp. FSP13]